MPIEQAGGRFQEWNSLRNCRSGHEGISIACQTDDARILGKQLLRSGTSVGANYRAACRARSRAEFVAKLGMVLEEADETTFGLELIQDAGLFPEEKLRAIVQEAKELVAIFVASVRKAKGLTSSI
ncbi:MAG TPA: four helix bundle protein [Terriglobales bacterium]